MNCVTNPTKRDAVVIELRRGEVAEVVLNNFYQRTFQMQTVFGINMVSLVDGRPRLLNLKQMLSSSSATDAMW